MRRLFFIFGVLLLLLLDLSSCKTKKEVVNESVDSVFNMNRVSETHSDISFSVQYPTSFDSLKLDSIPYLILPLDDGKVAEIPLLPGTDVNLNVKKEQKNKEKIKARNNANKNHEVVVKDKKECHFVIPLLIVLILFCLLVKFRKKIKETFVYIRKML